LAGEVLRTEFRCRWWVFRNFETFFSLLPKTLMIYPILHTFMQKLLSFRNRLQLTVQKA